MKLPEYIDPVLVSITILLLTLSLFSVDYIKVSYYANHKYVLYIKKLPNGDITAKEIENKIYYDNLTYPYREPK